MWVTPSKRDGQVLFVVAEWLASTPSVTRTLRPAYVFVQQCY
jgi:hypothetical protein